MQRRLMILYEFINTNKAYKIGLIYRSRNQVMHEINIPFVADL